MPTVNNVTITKENGESAAIAATADHDPDADVLQLTGGVTTFETLGNGEHYRIESEDLGEIRGRFVGSSAHGHPSFTLGR